MWHLPIGRADGRTKNLLAGLALVRTRPRVVCMTNSAWKTTFLRARDPDQMMRIVGEASGEESRARGHRLHFREEEITIEFHAGWTDSVPSNLVRLLQWQEAFKLLHSDSLFGVKTIAGDLEFSKHTKPKELRVCRAAGCCCE